MPCSLELLLFCALSASFGSVIGCFTGLMPGLHPNTVAILFVSIPGLTAFFGMIAQSAGHQTGAAGAIIAGAFLVGVLFSHSFVEIIPTAKMGIIGDDTAVALLPSQRLFAVGRGDLIVDAVTIGGLGAVGLFAIVLFPIRAVMGDPLGLYACMNPSMSLLLIGICALVLYGESRRGRLGKSLILFVLSGLLGLFVLRFQVPYIVTNILFKSAWDSCESSFLLPVFSGFFAIPAVILSSGSRHGEPGVVRSREILGGESQVMRPLMRGVIPSLLVGWIPGITNAYATALSFSFGRGRSRHILDSYRYLITYSAVNIGGALNALLALATIDRSRNGTLEAISSFLNQDSTAWSSLQEPPFSLIFFLLAACIASVIGAAFSVVIGGRILRAGGSGPGRLTRYAIVSFLLGLILWSSGPIGYAVLFPCVLLGCWAIVSGSPRIHLMGFLLLPVIAYFLER